MPISQIYLAEPVLTDAQIKALPTTPLVLVDGIADAVIYPLFAHVRMQWVADYTGIDPSSVFRITVGAGAELLIPLQETVGSSVSILLAGGGPDGSNAFMQPRFLTAGGAFSSIAGFYDSDVAGLDLSVRIDNGAVDLTGGNVGNSLTVRVAYMVLPV